MGTTGASSSKASMRANSKTPGSTRPSCRRRFRRSSRGVLRGLHYQNPNPQETRDGSGRRSIRRRRRYPDELADVRQMDGGHAVGDESSPLFGFRRASPTDSACASLLSPPSCISTPPPTMRPAMRRSVGTMPISPSTGRSAIRPFLSRCTGPGCAMFLAINFRI